MEFVSVQSSNIAGVHYDADASQLTVEFKTGSRYRYDGVPLDEYEALLGAPSKGVYFNDYIKNSYPAARV